MPGMAAADARVDQPCAESAAAVIVVNPPGQVHLPVPVQVTGGAPAVAEVARLVDGPTPRPVAQPDHDLTAHGDSFRHQHDVADVDGHAFAHHDGHHDPNALLSALGGLVG